MSSPFAFEGRRYLELDYSVIPIFPKSKRPGRWDGSQWIGMNDWNIYGERFATEEEVAAWELWPDAGLGLLTGVLSGVVAADFDLREDIHRALEEIMPPSPVRKAGAKGYTAFYQYTGEANQKWSVGGETVLEILSTGRQTLLPPTIHPSGEVYRWLTPDSLLTIGAREELPKLPPESEIQAVFARFDPKFQTGRPFTSEYRAVSGDGRLFFEDFDRAKEALKFVSPDDYHDWINVGMAIHSAFPGEEGFNLWLAWSKNSSKHKPNDCESRWGGFATTRSPRRLTIASIFKRASDNGWRDESQKTGLYSSPRMPLFAEPERLKKISKEKISWSVPESIALSAPGITGKIVNWILETSIRRQPALALGASLAFVGAIEGQRVMSPTDLRTNLFLLGIAQSGSGKQQPMKAIQHLAATVRGLQDLIAGEPTSDAGLFSLLKGDYGPKLIQWDEFGLALQGITSDNASAHSTAIMKWLNTMFSSANCKLLGKEYANVDGKFKRIDLNNPHLCVFGVSAPGAFYKSLKSEHAASGFLPRFLILEVETSFPEEQIEPRRLSDIPTDILDECGEIVALPRNVNPLGNLDQNINPRLVTISREAWELLSEKKKYYEFLRNAAQKSDRKDGLSNIWSRAAEHVVKIALTVSGLDEISFEAMQFAVNLVDQCLNASSDLLVMNVSDSRYGASSQKCLQLIRDAGVDGLQQSELTKKTQNITRFERDSVIKDLIEAGLIFQEVIASGKAGRPSVYYTHSEFVSRDLDA